RGQQLEGDLLDLAVGVLDEDQDLGHLLFLLAISCDLRWVISSVATANSRGCQINFCATR
ncbi:MAG: hypothetical protein ACRDV2_09120, partial [Actinomycetes bacterium]